MEGYKLPPLSFKTLDFSHSYCSLCYNTRAFFYLHQKILHSDDTHLLVRISGPSNARTPIVSLLGIRKLHLSIKTIKSQIFSHVDAFISFQIVFLGNCWWLHVSSKNQQFMNFSETMIFGVNNETTKSLAVLR
jgi:hypothetical protein